MTNELEKKFFQCFGIEPKNISTGECKYKITPEFCKSNCLDCKNTIKESTYPQISDTHYLKLICILHTTNIIQLCTTNIEDLKEEILMTACCWVDRLGIKHQVRTLFEEG